MYNVSHISLNSKSNKLPILSFLSLYPLFPPNGLYCDPSILLNRTACFSSSIFDSGFHAHHSYWRFLTTFWSHFFDPFDYFRMCLLKNLPKMTCQYVSDVSAKIYHKSIHYTAAQSNAQKMNLFQYSFLRPLFPPSHFIISTFMKPANTLIWKVYLIFFYRALQRVEKKRL